jgi:dephospho-CoA kinase
VGKTLLKHQPYPLAILLPAGVSLALGWVIARTQVIGLTGGICCGKSTLDTFFRQRLGWPVIDCDLIADELRRPGQTGHRFVQRRLGPAYVLPSGELNRELLSHYVFTNPGFRREFSSVMHRGILKGIIRQLLACMIRGEKVVVLDAPLLFESRFLEYFLWPIINVDLP